MAPKDWYVFYFCFQRPVLEGGSYCPCQALSMYLEEVFIAQESYSSIIQKNEWMQQTREQSWNTSGIKLAGKINKGQSSPAAFLQSLWFT